MMIWSTTALLLVFGLSVRVSAQDLPLALDPDSEDGRILLEIGEEGDDARKLQMMETFAAKFPKHEGLTWVLVQLQRAYLKLNQLDKVLATGEKLRAISPDNLEAVHNSLRAAEAKKDIDLIRKWSVETWEVSKRVAVSPKPDDEEQLQFWKDRVEYAKSLHSYSEYALYANAVTATDPKKRIELLHELEQRNPRSSYLSQLHSQYYTAFRQLGNVQQSVVLAEKSFKEGKADEDMLTLLTVTYHQRKDAAKTLFYASKVIEMMARKARPENLKPEEWEKKKALALGNAHYLTGVIYSEQDRFSEADRALRAGLPYLKYDEYVRASALFHLGWANYKLGEQAQSPGLIKEALRFNSACAAIHSPFRQQALKNLEAIKIEYDLQ
jgi:hypothetical protein